jgi:hypothetical protein
MAQRINGRLAAWVRMPGPALGADLIALGELPDQALQDRARTLFTKVLDAPGGGLRIQTIQSVKPSLCSKGTDIFLGSTEITPRIAST